MVQIRVTVTGADRMDQQLEKISQALQDGPGLDRMTEVGQAAMADVDARFDTAGYGTWVPLSPITIARKGHDTILIDTGNMRASVGISDVKPTRVTVTVPYGGKDNDPAVPVRHQLGLGTNLPQRKIVDVTPQLLERLTPIILDWLGGVRE